MIKTLTALIAMLTLGTFVLYQKTHPDYSIQSEQFEELLKISNINVSSNAEKQYRMKVYSDNKKFIEQQQKVVDYEMSVNEYALYTYTEFKERYTMKDHENKIEQQPIDKQNDQKEDNLQYVRKKNWVGTLDQSPVRYNNQNSCTAGYAITTAELVESWVLKTRYTNSQLSAQEILDCSRSQNNNGCQGGLVTQALEYVKQNGISEERVYPFTGLNQQCRGRQPFAGVKAFYLVQERDVMMEALDLMPIAVAMEFERNMQFYSGGIYKGNPNCGTQSINHFVLCSGYYYDSIDTTQRFWYLKHSLGANWGDKGYMAIDMDYSCGVSRNYYNVAISG